MNNKAFILGFVLVVGIGMAALPAVSAQWGGGDSDSNTGDGNPSDGDTSDDSDSTWGGGDSDSNTGDDNEGDIPEDDSSGSSSSGRSRGGSLHIIDGLTGDSLDAWLSEDSIPLGSSVTVEGELDDDNNAEREIDIYLEDELVGTAITDENGNFQQEVTPSEAGEQTIRVEKDHLNVELSLQVTDGSLSIDGLTSTIGNQAGQRTTVCGNVNSHTEDTEVTLYHNNQQFETQTGTGQICFDPLLRNGQNTFRMVAEADGQRAEAQTSRHIGGGTNTGTGNGGAGQQPTGNFLSSNATTAALGILGLIALSGILALILRKQGYSITRQQEQA